MISKLRMKTEIEPSAPALQPPNAPLIGVDFSSSPTRRKPVVVALGGVPALPSRPASAHPPIIQLQRLERFDSLASFGRWLIDTPAWIGGFDLPFGLPRELVQHLGWPTVWRDCIAHYTQMTRPQIRDTFAAFCAARPVGAKFAHRACDGPAGSSPSMKWVNPPVAYMLHAGVPALLAAGAWCPAHEAWPQPSATALPSPVPSPMHPPWRSAQPQRIALEAYPGLLARELIGTRSYKSDDRAKQTPERLIARKDIVDALEQGRTRLGLRLKLSAAQRDALAADASGDALDSVLCLLQIAWAQRQPGWGLPAHVDRLEGWIASAPLTAPSPSAARSGRSATARP